MSTKDTNPAETAQDGGIPTFTVDEVFADPAPEAMEAVARFARDLAGELREIQGQEITLDGKVYLVTTEAQILDWIAWHLHQPEEDENEDGKQVSSCPCGWTAGPFGTWREAADASDAHRADGLAQLCAEGGAVDWSDELDHPSGVTTPLDTLVEEVAVEDPEFRAAVERHAAESPGGTR